jgi:hypothetical protein
MLWAGGCEQYLAPPPSNNEEARSAEALTPPIEEVRLLNFII